MSLLSPAVRREFVQSPNYTATNTTKRYILVHWWDKPSVGATHAGVKSWFRNRSANVSAHYVCSANWVTQMVREAQYAWHAGSTRGNNECVGVELSPYATEDDYRTAAELIADIRSRLGNLPLRRHRDYTSTDCPGVWDLAKLDRMAREVASGKKPASKPSPSSPSKPSKPTRDIQWAQVVGYDGDRADCILRTGPGLKNRAYRTMYAGEFVLLGERTSGNWVEVGDAGNYVHKGNLRMLDKGPVLADGLNHGQFPDRDIPVNGTKTKEHDFGRVDLAQRMGESAGSTNSRWRRFLEEGNPYLRDVNGHVRTIKTHLNELGLYEGTVDNRDNANFRSACKKYMNEQRKHYTPQPPTATSWARNFKG